MDETNNMPDTVTKYRIHYVQKNGKKGHLGLAFPESDKQTAYGFSDYLNRLYRADKYYVVAVQIPVMDVKTG
jgi:hypothetical protein